MSKLDVYLRSIEKFGATGALLTSNQAVTLKFPTGDRHATQVTPHDQLVMLVREIAPPAALDQIDRQRPARFDYDSNGIRYGINVMPGRGAGRSGSRERRRRRIPRLPGQSLRRPGLHRSPHRASS